MTPGCSPAGELQLTAEEGLPQEQVPSVVGPAGPWEPMQTQGPLLDLESRLDPRAARLAMCCWVFIVLCAPAFPQLKKWDNNTCLSRESWGLSKRTHAAWLVRELSRGCELLSSIPTAPPLRNVGTVLVVGSCWGVRGWCRLWSPSLKLLQRRGGGGNGWTG